MMPKSILIVEDEAALAANIDKFLSKNGYETQVVDSGEAACAALENFHPDIALVDYRLPGIDGLQTLQELRRLDPTLKLIMITGQGGVDTAVAAMKLGACDYLSKPLALAELRLLLEKATGQERLESTLAYYQDKEAHQSGLSKLLGESPSMVAVKERIQRFIDAEARLTDGASPAALITGETGTGKELVARALHFDGSRRRAPFLEINCAAVPEHLLESELCGFERGAFTDARERKPGLMEAADSGTLFFDEVGEMALPMQAKLLKLVEDKSVRRLGSVRDRTVDVRIIAATNQLLEEKVQAGTFRSDLFFRLRVIHIELPPLRERGADISMLADIFLQKHWQRYRKGSGRLSREAKALLVRYPWPGNVRELMNVIEQAVLVAKTEIVTPDDLGLSMKHGLERAGCEADSTLDLPVEGIDLEQMERDFVKQALTRVGWNITQASKLLGITRDTLRYRIDKFGLRSPP